MLGHGSCTSRAAQPTGTNNRPRTTQKASNTDNITGLPAHPLLVHVPVVLLPPAAIGVVFLIVRRTWYLRYRWAVLAIGAIGTVGAILAVSSGESLEGQIRAKEGADAAREIHDHAQAGDLARTLAIVFFVALAAYVVIPWILDRRAPTSTPAERGDATPPTATTNAVDSAAAPIWLRAVLATAVAATAVASMVSIIDAGHSGASRAWDEYNTSNNGG